MGVYGGGSLHYFVYIVYDFLKSFLDIQETRAHNEDPNKVELK